MILLAVLPPTLPLVFIWLARRRWPMWNELRLTAPAVVVWLMSIAPTCMVVTIVLAELSVVSQPVRMGSYRRDGEGEYPLRLSHYDPALGGTNCDNDCSTMASGDKVSSWVGGRNGIYAAACPREWGWQHGTRFTVAGLEFECRDTGGWINCYNPGEYDPALKTNASMEYCWVDLLTSPVADYGALTNDWRFE